MEEIGKDCDVLTHESTLDDDDETMCKLKNLIKRYFKRTFNPENGLFIFY
jgi:hypothetical protein